MSKRTDLAHSQLALQHTNQAHTDSKDADTDDIARAGKLEFGRGDRWSLLTI